MAANFIRFNLSQRVQHIILMVIFTALAVTGLAQRFHTAGWAEWVIMGLGGIEQTRLIHRIFGLLFTLSIVYHFSEVAISFFVHRSRLSMIPTLSDFRAVAIAVKHGFGFTDRRPQFGRFDYSQKFEYWGLIFGSLVLTVTGFVLAFPVTFTRLLPGQVVAASVEFHGYEATLAVLTIIVWHFYDVFFKPGVFPVDTSIHTGKISEKRMLEEHPLEYAEMVAEALGEADALPAEQCQPEPAEHEIQSPDTPESIESPAAIPDAAAARETQSPHACEKAT
ncbi:MAG: DUF4405 domain-containing protein [Chloroflexi bacterium]|nr:DUF4405 domain-containing protein [Chloroflexota bacterium]